MVVLVQRLRLLAPTQRNSPNCRHLLDLVSLDRLTHLFLVLRSARHAVVRGRVPQLKKLELVAYENGNFAVPSINSFSIAPNLRDIILTDSEYHVHSLPVCIPWGQITRYRGVYHAERQLEVLEASFNLIECGLSFVAEKRVIPGDKMANLPHLRRLYVGDSHF